MQQTDKYKLNLIETSDPFSPDALNRNTQKVEDALLEAGAARAALDSRATSLERRVTAVEARKVAVGSYDADGQNKRVFNLGFTPAAVFVWSTDYYSGTPRMFSAVAGEGSYNYSGERDVTIVTNGFRLESSEYNNTEVGCRYYFLALA